SPSRLLIVATTIWSEDFCSKAARRPVRSASVSSSSMPALSTTRPVSAGRSAAAAITAAKRRNASSHPDDRPWRQAIDMPTGSAVIAEIHLRNAHVLLGDREGLHGGRVGEPELCPQDRRKGPQRCVVEAHGLDIVPPGNGDPVFRPLELGLKRKEVLARLQ